MNVTPEILPGFRRRFDEVWNGGGGAFSFGNAVLFDGINDEITFGNNIYCPTANPFTVSAWFNSSDVSAFQTIAALRTGVANNPYSMLITTNGSYNDISIGSNATYGRFRASFSLANNTWFHLMLTYDGVSPTTGSSFKIYINGISQTVNSSAGFTTIADENVLGNDARDTSQPFKGMIDEFAIWTNTLGTQQNATDLYNSGNGALASSIIASPDKYFRLDSSSGIIAVDDGTEATNGTLVNFADPNSAWVPHT